MPETQTPRSELLLGRGEERPASAVTPVAAEAGSLLKMVLPEVVGADLSLTSTGVACPHGVQVITSSGHTADPIMVRAQRIRAIRDRVSEWTAKAHLVVLEAPSYGSRGAFTSDRDGLWWLVVDSLIRRGVPFAAVAPATRAKYITGNGRADKAEVVEAARRHFPTYAIAGDDEADAVGLVAMGLDWLGFPIRVLPQRNRDALKGVRWPDGLVAA